MVFHLALRQTEGFLQSLFTLLDLNCRAPDHTTISRRARKLGKLPICPVVGGGPVHILVDSTGLSIHVGKLRKPPKNKDWRKLHVAVNALTGEVVACDVTSKSARDASRVPALLKQIESPLASVRADGAYDKEAVYEAAENHTDNRSPRVLIPPKKNAQLKPEVVFLKERNRNIALVHSSRDSLQLPTPTTLTPARTSGWPRDSALQFARSDEPVGRSPYFAIFITAPSA